MDWGSCISLECCITFTGSKLGSMRLDRDRWGVIFNVQICQIDSSQTTVSVLKVIIIRMGEIGYTSIFF